MFGLGKLLYVVLLTVNGIAVLSEDRFLNRVGWRSSDKDNTSPQFQQFGNAQGDNYTIKKRLINLISAVRTLMRLPLIFINIIFIFYELVLG